MEKSLTNLNSEQKQAVTHKAGPLLIVAGAGTGKTTVIARRLAWLIEKSLAGPDEILALTFTDKASEEMEERVDKLLPYGYVDLWISTFHSFCERILKSHGLDIGLSTDFKLLTQTDQWLLIRQNLDRFNLDYYRPLGNPTKFIQALITHFSRLKDEEIWPAEYLEYAEKLTLNIGVKKEEGGIKNIKKSKAQIIPNYSKSIPKSQIQMPKDELEPNEIARIDEAANAYHTYQQLLHENNYLDFGDLINYTLKLFRTRKNLLAQFQSQFKYILVDEFQDTNWAQYDLVKLLAGKKKDVTVVGDDDQAIYKFRGASLSNILQFEKDFPECSKVVLTKNYRSCQNILDLSYKFIQFNNPNRLEVALLDSNRLGQGTQPTRIGQGTQPTRIGQGTQPARDEFGQGVQPARDEFGQGVQPTRDEFQPARKDGISKKLLSQTPGQAEIKHLHCQTSEDEVALVIKKIIDLKNNDKASTWSDFAVLIRANSQADGFCRGFVQASIPHQFLASKGLYIKPVIMDILAYFKLLDNYHESAALFRMLNSPIFKISPGDQSKLTYRCYRTSDSLYESLQKIAAVPGVSEDSVKKAGRLLGFIEKHSYLAKQKNVGELFVTVIKDLGYEQYLAKKDDQLAHEQLSYLNQFYKRLQKFEAGNLDPKLRDFMMEINLEIEAGEQGKLQFDVETGPDMVKIMTVHGAKGLEFKYVFIANLVDKRFPTIERRDQIEIPDELVKEILPAGDIHLEEERRLFYVAMTRAKSGLYFTSAEDYGGTRAKKLSRFLYELGLTEQRYKTQDTSSKQFPISQQKKSIKPSATENYLPNHFSFSQLAAFKKCPLQYKYAFILHVPVYGKANFSFGRTMHSTLQKYFAKQMSIVGSQSSLFINTQEAVKKSALTGQARQNTAKELPPLSELLKLYEESWLDDWYSSKSEKKEYKEKGRKILKDFYEKIKEGPPQVAGLETNFNLRLGNYAIRGRIDRIDKTEEGVELVDYKTGAPKEKLISEDKEQLLIYQIGCEEVLRKKPVKLTYWYLDDNKPVSFLGTDEEKEKFKKDVTERIEQIRKSDFKAIPGWQCKFCDFREICEQRAE